MVILAGDHGPRIDRKGVYHTTTGWQDSGIFQVPLLVHAPGLRRDKQPRQPFVSVDIVPTIMDALEFPAHMIAAYPGQSLLRARGATYDRMTFHAQNPGGNARQATWRSPEHSYKAVIFDDGDGDICGTDLMVDPTEEFFYCVKQGWRPVNVGGELVDGLSQGLWRKGSKEEEALVEWILQAKSSLEEHIQANAAQWNRQHSVHNGMEQNAFLDAAKDAIVVIE